ncbi:hypothetical protein DY000_02057781, partial [Brassica cretica]
VSAVENMQQPLLGCCLRPTLDLLPASLLGGVERDQVSIPPCSSGYLRLRDQQWHVHAHSYLCRSDATGRSFSRKELLFTFGLMKILFNIFRLLAGNIAWNGKCSGDNQGRSQENFIMDAQTLNKY